MLSNSEHFQLDRGTNSVRMGKKKNRNAVSERQRRPRHRGSSADKARGVSMQLVYIWGLGERCKLPQRVRAELGRQTTYAALGSSK